MSEKQIGACLENVKDGHIHQITFGEENIGRGWLNCEDKRISRKHAKMRVNEDKCIVLTPIHQNPLFYMLKDNSLLQIASKGCEIELNIGDSFGLLPDLFWFKIIPNNLDSGTSSISEFAEHNNENHVLDTTLSQPLSNQHEEDQESMETRTSLKRVSTWSGSEQFDLKKTKNNHGGNKVMAQYTSAITMDTESIETPCAPTIGSSMVATEMRIKEEIIGDFIAIKQNIISNQTNDANVVDCCERSSLNDIPNVIDTENQSLASQHEQEQQSVDTCTSPKRVSTLPEQFDLIEAKKNYDGNNLTDIANSILYNSTITTESEFMQTSDARTIASSMVASEIKIKEEPVDDVITIKQEFICNETNDSNVASSCASSSNHNPVVHNSSTIKTESTESQEVTSSLNATLRESCMYGVRCYRRSHMHRTMQAHPGDSDYRRPTYEDPPDGTPPCPYGTQCYRRNPTHFRQYSHPSSMKASVDRNDRQVIKRKTIDSTKQSDQSIKRQRVAIVSDRACFEDESDLSDPFEGSDSEDNYDPEEDLASY